jgi:hypothetical protein
VVALPSPICLPERGTVMNYTDKLLLKLTCFVTDDPKSEDDSNDYIEEFSLPSITGITYDDYFLYKFLDFSKEIKRAILGHRKNRKHYDCKGRENYISKRKLKKSGGAREDEKENIDNMCKLL